ncbi:MAG TPA: ATP-dependent protease, partial [Burkholderiales bacterium]|nr:ATP-dependent protease [Burkholderiales bacterium]
IEGFFDICRSRGLSGEQGVLIPATNVEHLMLRNDVVAAAAAGKFHIYPVATVDEAITLLTGIPAGEAGAAATTENTINGRVAKRLYQLTALRQSFAAGGAARRPVAPQREKRKRG